MIEVKRLSPSLYSLLELLISKKARYVMKYTFMRDEGFPLHYHSNVDEFIILLNGTFSLRYGNERNSISEIKLDNKNDIFLVMIPRTILHTLISMVDDSEYIVIKKFNDAMVL